MTCKDCIHYEACEATRNEIIGMSEKIIEGLVRQSHSLVYDESRKANFCNYFKDRSKFIELPCKVGDTFYGFLNGFAEKFKCFKLSYSYDKNNEVQIILETLIGDKYIFGESAFLTKEEAEQALKRGENVKKTL